MGDAELDLFTGDRVCRKCLSDDVNAVPVKELEELADKYESTANEYYEIAETVDSEIGAAAYRAKASEAKFTKHQLNELIDEYGDSDE